MKPMQENYQRFVLLGVCSPAESINRLKESFNTFVSILCPTVLLITFGGSFVFFWQNMTIDLANVISACFQIAAIGTALYSLITAHVKRIDLIEIFDAFQTFYDTNIQSDPQQNMVQADQQGANIAKFFDKYFLIPCPLNILGLSIGSAVYNKWAYGHIDPHKLFRAYRFVYEKLSLREFIHLLFWNQNTIPGWMAEVVLVSLLPLVFCLIVPAFLSWFISICKYHGAFYEMFRFQIKNIDATTRFQPLPITRIKELINDSILFHNSAKVLFHQTAETFSPFIFSQLVATVIFLACSTFQMDMAIHNLNLEFIMMIFATFIGALTLYFYCYFGMFATNSYSEYANCLFKSNWTILPVNLQNYFIFMITHAQKPLFYHGYGLVNLNLETFLAMIKTVVTYYAMFKTLTSA